MQLHRKAILLKISSQFVSVRTGRGGLLSIKWTGIDKEERGLKNGRNVRKPFIDGLMIPKLHHYLPMHVFISKNFIAAEERIDLRRFTHLLANRDRI